ncbi:MAG: chemotaxis protein CheW [Phycisphaerae bacterium]|nr:chemotaxis protein CheW [Phycisphaerae bacterium]
MNQDRKLLLLVQCDDAEFAIACSDIVEVLPMIDLALPDNASPAITGTMNYHGSDVAIADFSEWMTGIKSARLLSTRIILLRSGVDKHCRVGIIAELATRTLTVPASAFSGYDTVPPNRYSKLKVTIDDRRLQLIDTESIFETIHRTIE